MAKEKLIIYGTGSYTEYVGYVFENDTNYEVIAYCVEQKVHNSKKFGNKPLVLFDTIEKVFPPNDVKIFVAVGNNLIRKRIFLSAKEKGYTMPSYVSSKANTWANLVLGENNFIDEGCTIQPFVKIGDNIIMYCSDLGHHTTIEDHSLLSVTVTGGNVHIGEESYIGMKSSIKQNIRIGKKNIIGMGCIIQSNTEDEAVFTQKGTEQRDIPYYKIADRFLK